MNQRMEWTDKANLEVGCQNILDAKEITRGASCALSNMAWGGQSECAGLQATLVSRSQPR